MTVPRCNHQLRADIKERIASGKFNLGIPVFDNEYIKVVLTSEGNIEKKVCTVSARKFVQFLQESILCKTSAFKVLRLTKIF